MDVIYFFFGILDLNNLKSIIFICQMNIALRWKTQYYSSIIRNRCVDFVIYSLRVNTSVRLKMITV